MRRWWETLKMLQCVCDCVSYLVFVVVLHGCYLILVLPLMFQTLHLSMGSLLPEFDFL